MFRRKQIPVWAAVAAAAILTVACGSPPATTDSSAPAGPSSSADGGRSDGGGPGELAAFTEIDSVQAPRAEAKAEVTKRRDLDRYLADLPEKTADRIRARLAAYTKSRDRQGERLFAFQLTGCRLDGADLYVYADERGLSAVPHGGENVRCVRPVHYLAVFALPSPLVPGHPLG